MIGNKIKGLGEVVLRVKNMGAVKDFYQNTIGLELLKDGNGHTFFKIAEGYRGHFQILALFESSIPTAFGQVRDNIKVNNSSLHHLALEIDKNDYDIILKKLKTAGIELKTQKFEWVKWKSIFLKDPEMNIVELVCYDSEIL